MSEHENLSSAVWAEAWNELYKCFGERLQQEEMDLMDTILEGVVADVQDRERQLEGESA